MFVHTDHKGLMFFLETKQLNPRHVRWLKELACYDFAIKYIKSENNFGADALNRRPDYKNKKKLIKPMLVKNGDYMQITEATEENNDIIRNRKIYQKLPDLCNGKTRQITQKKNCINF